MGVGANVVRLFPEQDRAEPLLGKREVARRLGRSPRTIERWTAQAGFPCVQHPATRSVWYRWSEVEAWLGSR